MNILCSSDGFVIGSGEYCVFGEYEGEQKWKINDYLYAIDDNYSAYDIGDTEIPDGTFSGKYLYQDGAFVENPDWVEPPLPLEEQVAQLQAQLNALLGEE